MSASRPSVDVWICQCVPERQLRLRSERNPHTLMVDIGHGVVARGGIVVRLAATARHVLLALASSPGAPIPQRELIERIYGDRADGGPVNIEAPLQQARDAAYALGLIVKAHKGRGYVIAAPRREAA